MSDQQKAPRIVITVFQVVGGAILGALLWTAVQVFLPDFSGHWIINAVIVGPLIAGIVSIAIFMRARSWATFGISIFVGAAVYGIPFTFLVLKHV